MSRVTTREACAREAFRCAGHLFDVVDVMEERALIECLSCKGVYTYTYTYDYENQDICGGPDWALPETFMSFLEVQHRWVNGSCPRPRPSA